MTFTLAIDAMGGDIGTAVTVPAAIEFLKRHPNVQLLLVGLPDTLEHELAKYPSAHDRIEIVPANEIVGMDEAPQSALKNKKNSSMRVAINLVKQGRAAACVSAGNTGALMATARFVLKTLPDIDRPAIAKLMPSVSEHESCMLDLGANVDCTPQQLLQFGRMGAALISALRNTPNPRIGLLNIGSEDIKGTDTIKQAAELFRASNLNFVGNVEGNDIYLGSVDVIVCDGFTGNVALKTSEGLARLFGIFAREEFSRSSLSRLSAVAAAPVLKRLKKRLDPRRYNGASLLGLRGIVVKSHGGTDSFGFLCALEQALNEVRSDVIHHMTHYTVAAPLDSESDA